MLWIKIKLSSTHKRPELHPDNSLIDIHWQSLPSDPLKKAVLNQFPVYHNCPKEFPHNPLISKVRPAQCVLHEAAINSLLTRWCHFPCLSNFRRTQRLFPRLIHDGTVHQSSPAATGLCSELPDGGQEEEALLQSLWFGWAQRSPWREYAKSQEVSTPLSITYLPTNTPLSPLQEEADHCPVHLPSPVQGGEEFRHHCLCPWEALASTQGLPLSESLLCLNVQWFLEGDQ